ncbi:type II toxin-antitoxin system Phd/YefM family antitoxin, partial [Candidatus Sumerlaeota bacterium]|nr:type II toxin-antitoxin system Phd/YefM family antitoxin [Candidatus Sumerlaeota bacterium]
MNTIQDSQPIGSLKHRSGALLKRIAETGRPIVLTQNGRPAAVLQDAKGYQEMIEIRD